MTRTRVTSRASINGALSPAQPSSASNHAARKCVVRVLRRSTATSASQPNDSTSPLARLLAGGSDVTKQRKRRRRKKSKSRASNEQKASKVLGIIFAVFVLLWTPFFVLNILGSLVATPPYLFAVFTWLGYLSSLMNPIIYTMFNTSFRRAFKRILCCQGDQPPHRARQQVRAPVKAKQTFQNAR